MLRARATEDVIGGSLASVNLLGNPAAKQEQRILLPGGLAEAVARGGTVPGSASLAWVGPLPGCPPTSRSSTFAPARGQAGAQVLLVRQALGAMAMRTDHVAADKEAEAAQLASLEEAVGGGVLEEGQQRRGSGSVRCIQGAAGRVGLAQTALAASTKQVMQRHITIPKYLGPVIDDLDTRGCLNEFGIDRVTLVDVYNLDGYQLAVILVGSLVDSTKGTGFGTRHFLRENHLTQRRPAPDEPSRVRLGPVHRDMEGLVAVPSDTTSPFVSTLPQSISMAAPPRGLPTAGPALWSSWLLSTPLWVRL
ncbi:hypothetical protein PG996_007546 [Apiospora saccharicola]|uniref:Uncharacterized protein n=1 Tax=Apiospora saccharicola TaxID=335842 RepID=A0ABR1VEL1_9PEZI